MPDYIQEYNFNSVYISIILLVAYHTNYKYYIDVLLSNIYLLNYTSLLIIINIICLYIMLTRIKINVEVKWSVKYN